MLAAGLILMLICCVSRIKIHIQECCGRGLGYGVHGAEESTEKSILTQDVDKMMPMKGESLEVKHH